MREGEVPPCLGHDHVLQPKRGISVLAVASVVAVPSSKTTWSDSRAPLEG